MKLDDKSPAMEKFLDAFTKRVFDRARAIPNETCVTLRIRLGTR